jgi:hypothetical protein
MMTDKELNTVRMPVEGRDFTIEPKREWVWLTDKEIDEIHGWAMRLEHSSLMGFVRAIEAKLREKNG